MLSVNVNPRGCICEQMLPMQTASSCSGSPASQRNGRACLPASKGGPLAGGSTCYGVHFTPQRPLGSVQPSSSPAQALLSSFPALLSSSLSEGSPPSGFHVHRDESRLRLSSRQPGPRQHFYTGACAYANVHAHTVVFLCAHIQGTWEELGQRASWRKLIYIFYWGR